MQTTLTVGRTKRVYELKQMEIGPLMIEDMKKRGWDGTCWIGESKPTGRQRKTYHAMFYRAPNGDFHNV